MMVSTPLSNSLASNQAKEMIFDFSANPVLASGVDHTLQVVFKGTLGSELDAVASGRRELTDPMFITRHNLYDYIASDYNRPELLRNYFGLSLPGSPAPPPVPSGGGEVFVFCVPWVLCTTRTSARCSG